MFSDADRGLIFKLVEELTGATRSGENPQDSLLGNVERRMSELKINALVDYLKLVSDDRTEFDYFLSAVTIHTTSWFRENPHFVAFQEILLEMLKKDEVFKLWCAACSTGEEVYSFALMLEEFRRIHPKFDYRILGTDIDEVSLQTAARAVYPKRQMNFHVGRYKNHILEGHGKSADYFTLSKNIRERVTFKKFDLRDSSIQSEGLFHVCICRNVLIYFSVDTVKRVVANLLANVLPEGHLMLGHSESVDAQEFDLIQRGHSVYKRKSNKADGASGRYRILSIDDSALMRKLLHITFTDMGFESVVVSSASEATSYLNFNDVDLITLDLNLPDMKGDRWLEGERAEGLRAPVVVISDVHASEAKEVVDLLSKGAQDYIEKDQIRKEPEKLKERIQELIRALGAKETGAQNGGSFPSWRPDVILIGASTGGPQALVKLLQEMPANCPPILVTQHMSPKFMRPMSERLADVSKLKLGNLEDKAPILAGHIYMASGDYHIGLGESGKQLVLALSDAPAYNGHRPSVDFMFNSTLGVNCHVMAILLTGMGRDGALGMRFLRKEGAFCIAQSEDDCVVFGMPKEAIKRGSTDFVGTIEDIRNVLLGSLSLSSKKAA
jgi:chemotaxis response regulator CheB/chemotaxis methyl-accepting protein methylase